MLQVTLRAVDVKVSMMVRKVTAVVVFAGLRRSTLRSVVVYAVRVSRT